MIYLNTTIASGGIPTLMGANGYRTAASAAVARSAALSLPESTNSGWIPISNS